MTASTLATRHRVPAGMRNGGQFAPTPHSEPDVALAAPARSWESNGERVAREAREYAAAKSAAQGLGLPLDYDRFGHPFAHHGACVVLGANGQPVAAVMTAHTLGRALDDLLDSDDEEAEVRAAVHALTPHVSDDAFVAVWPDLWKATNWTCWWENDPGSAAEADPDDDEQGGAWADMRYRLGQQLAADELAAART